MTETNNIEATAGTLLRAPGGDAATIVETARAAAEPRKVERGELYVVVDAEGAHKVIDLSDHEQETPFRIVGTYRPATVDALIAYVKEHDSKVGRTTVWVHPTEGKVRVLLDDNGPATPQWRGHRADLDLLVAPEWAHWTRRDGILGSQEEFAEHIEDGVQQLVEPAAAEMLEIAQSFHAAQAATIRHARRLDSGQVNVVYTEDIQASAGEDGQLTVPQEFRLAIPPFVGEDPYEVTARLRFRLNAGNLKIGYRLDQPEAVVRDALEKIHERLDNEFEHVYMGTPA